MKNSKDNWKYDYSLNTGTDHDLCAVDLAFAYNDEWLPVFFRLSYDNGVDDVRVKPIGEEYCKYEIPLDLFMEALQRAKSYLIEE